MIKTLCTLLVGGLILSMGTANAQSTDRETVTRIVVGSAGGRVAVALAGSLASTNAAVKNTKPDRDPTSGAGLKLSHSWTLRSRAVCSSPSSAFTATEPW